MVGDVCNTPGRSMFVRLTGPESGRGAAGHWTDAAVGEHGDLLDLIARNRCLDFPAALDEARSFLALPRPNLPDHPAPSGIIRSGPPAVSHGTPDPRHLVGNLPTITRDLRSTRLAVFAVPSRRLVSCPGRCASRVVAGAAGCRHRWQGADHRTPAHLDRPIGARQGTAFRSASGAWSLLGNGVRFGLAANILAAGEGIETVLALKSVLPDLPMVACLSANHLAALVLSPSLARLYVARDNDAAGRFAVERLVERGGMVGIDVRALVPWADDFNADLLRLGPDRMRQRLVDQLAPDDAQRFLFRRDAG